jgi:hypothetical protein
MMTNTRKRFVRRAFIVSILFCAVSLARLAALDVADGRIRLTLYEGMGRFSISCQTKGASGIFIPLLAAQDPRTTTLSIVVGNHVYRMGESSEFAESAEKTQSGARFVWKTSFLQVTESFTFITSGTSSLTNGVRIDLGLKNLSEQEISVGVRYLFDTYMGESSFIHFKTDTLSQLTHELTLTAADKTPYWVSPLAGDSDDFGFEVMAEGQGITTPDKIVFANWKRLSDASWSYDTSSVRNFSQLPYSVNDSAVSQYYDPRQVPRNGEATITLAMGLYTKEGFTGASLTTQDFSTAVQQTLQEAKTATDLGTAARADLATVNRLIAKINAIISAGGTVSPDDLAVLESALKDLESRATRYVPSSGK